MLTKILTIIILVVMVLFIAWSGTCVYSNFFAKPNTGQPDMPDSEKAAYSFHIKNTGGLILTDDYEVHGSEVGHRIFILSGFWELRGKDFKFMANDIILDESIFGEITLKRR